MQALRDVGYMAPDDEEQLPQVPEKEHVALDQRLFGAEKQRHLELQSHPLEHTVTAVCCALVLLSDAFLMVRPLPVANLVCGAYIEQVALRRELVEYDQRTITRSSTCRCTEAHN